MEMIAGHPVVARCQSVATLLVRREHSLHYRGQTRVCRCFDSGRLTPRPDRQPSQNFRTP